MKWIEGFSEMSYVDNLRIDPSIYRISYNASPIEFYELLKAERTLSFDFDSFKDSAFGQPIINVPVWGEVKGKTHIIGTAVIKYNYSNGEYQARNGICDIRGMIYDNGDYSTKPFEDLFTMEKISDFCEKRGISDVKNVALVNHNPLYSEEILLIETSDEVYVLDIWDTIGSGEIEYPGYDLEKEKLYPFEEYYEKYFERQKELGNEGFFRGAAAPIYGTQPKNYNWIYITVGASVTVVVGVSVLVFVIAVKKKKKTKVDALPENFIE
jgi:hypothetical protein